MIYMHLLTWDGFGLIDDRVCTKHFVKEHSQKIVQRVTRENVIDFTLIILIWINFIAIPLANIVRECNVHAAMDD
jgi:hypothetical protein